jgi:tRNA dimethylallyltransferase
MSDGSRADRLATDLAPPERHELTVVVGPTASGKTSLAVELSQRFGAEIVVADSVQLYRRFDVGSGKPTPAERAQVPHHLLDVADAKIPLDAAAFADKAEEKIAELHARGCPVVICGGTFLWVRALLFGLAEGAPRDEAVRARHQEIVARDGVEALHQALSLVDEASATKLHPNDVLRVSRALEVFELTGRPLSAVQGEHGFRAPRHRFRLVGPARGRGELDRRIELRIDEWLASGWLDEVRALLADGYGDTRAMASIGYKQLSEYVQAEGNLSLTETRLAIVRATRTLVRRQRTWLRDEPVVWLGEPG